MTRDDDNGRRGKSDRGPYRPYHTRTGLRGDGSYKSGRLQARDVTDKEAGRISHMEHRAAPVVVSTAISLSIATLRMPPVTNVERRVILRGHMIFSNRDASLSRKITWEIGKTGKP